MSDINTPRGDEHTQDAAEGPGTAEAPEERRHPDEPAEGADDGDDREPPTDMSSYNIEPPPAEGREVPGVPDAGRGLDEGTEDEPGANATGVSV